VDTLNRLLSPTGGAGRGGIGSFVGELYLDSGEFLGKVQGVARQIVADQSAADARNIRSSLR
jgi:hypothetical protein